MTSNSHPVRVDRVTFEHHRTPLGIGAVAPRLSWRVLTDEADWTQHAYEIVVDAQDGSRWSSGRIESADSVLVPWPAPVMASRERRAVRARVWGADRDEPSDWSRSAWVETGLLGAGDWQASAIGPAEEFHQPPPGPAALLRKEFTVGPGLVRARLYATAHGVYQVEVNGRRISDDILAPGWTSYSHRLRYQTYDVTRFLDEGDNAIGATLADGWYRGRLGFWSGRTMMYGSRLAFFGQLHLDYSDGSTQVVRSDESWRWSAGPVLSTGLYEGERYDARLEQTGWSGPGFDDRHWEPAEMVELDRSRLLAPDGPPIRPIERIGPRSVSPSAAGGLVLDFGQNISGRLHIRVQGSRGQTVSLRHAEVLQDGELCLRPLRQAEAVDEYTLRGGGTEEWEPSFTLHGFRYAEVTGWPGTLHPGDIEAVVCHTDMTRTGWFSCSDPLLNRLHENVVWSMRGNFVDIPTDCPQRDERLGWTGDIQVFAPTASFLYDCSGLLISWLADLAAEQAEYGTVPHYVPWVQLVFPIAPAAVWGDAAVLLPWALYQRFGDLGILQCQYPSMTAWVDQVAALAGEKHLWDNGFQFGDWLDPAAPPDRPEQARTDPYLIATAYHALTAQTLADIAALLGWEEDHLRYAALAEEVRAAFTAEYVTPAGRLAGDTQTAHALALHLDLLPKPAQREHAAGRLVQLLTADGFHIGTGFVGTPLICDALAGAGEHDSAYHLLTQQECPSWLYPVTMGATTMWERWDSMLPDGSVHPGDMTSFNHYAFGAVADWLHRIVAGLAPAAPGYRRLLISPRPGGGLTRAAAAHDTPYGRASVEWTRVGERLDVTVTVPPNTSAIVRLPSPVFEPLEVGSGRHVFSCAFRAAADDPAPPRRPDIRDAQR